ncbi:hypothetical protein BOX15_Mlig005596g1, partial [Macrostomum lignano]
ELAKHPGFIIVKAITPGLSSRDRIVSDRHPSKPTGNEVCIDLTGEGPCFGYALIRKSGGMQQKFLIQLNTDDISDPWTPAESYFKLKKDFVQLYLKKKE